jgi:hypothetical protein
MKYRVLFRTCPAWKVGERDVDAEKRRARAGNVLDAERYPGDYMGQVISVIPADKQFSAGDVADPSRAVMTLSLSEEEYDALRTRAHKVGADRRFIDVTFEDRWGAVAETLRSNIDNPEAAELGDRDSDIDALLFAEISELATDSLEKNDVHTGAGLYPVGPGQTYTTIQSAFDQLFTDQGAATFTSSQIIRVYADTYDENVVPSTSLAPDKNNGWNLFLEGNSGDALNTVVLEPTAGTACLSLHRNIFVRHLTITSTVCTTGIRNTASAHGTTISDCSVTINIAGAVDTVGINIRSACLIEDCTISVNGTASGSYGIRCIQDVPPKIHRCYINGNGTATRGIGTHIGCDIASSVIYGFASGIAQDGYPRYGPSIIRNAVIYNCTTAMHMSAWYATSYEMVNVIVHTCTTVFSPYNWWPERSSGADQTGAIMGMKHCFFYNYTNFGRQSLAPNATKTYAEWIAFNRVTAVANTDGVDPLFTDPGSADFSLQAASPCLNAGHGSGITYDINSTSFHKQTPDVGAISASAAGVTPTWTSDTSNITATDQGDGDGVSISFDASTLAPSHLTAEYAVQYQASGGDWSGATIAWIGTGTSVTLGGLTQDTAYDFRVGARTKDLGQSWSYASDSDSATPTGGASPSVPQITSVTNDGDGDGATATLVTDSGTDVYLYSRIRNSTDAWNAEGSRTDSGTISVSGLTNNSMYEFIAIATAGASVSDTPSLPSAIVSVLIIDSDADEVPNAYDDVIRSIIYFLKNARYTVRNTAGTLIDHFRDSTRGQADLIVRYGYPDEPIEVLPPCLVLASPTHNAPNNQAYGTQNIEETLEFEIFCFIGLESEGTERKSNQLLRDELMNDLYYLINEKDGQGRVVTLYEFDSSDNVVADNDASFRVERATVRPLDKVGEIDADRYGFVCSFTALLLTSR